jgi:chromosome segregation ATPase
MDRGQSSRPEDCKGSTFTVASQHAYFERWLLNMEELNRERFGAIKEAAKETKDAQTAYNERSNEFRGQLDDQAKRLMAREEALAKFMTYDEKLEDCKREINKLREAHMEAIGRTVQRSENRATAQWTIGQAISIALVIAGFVVALIEVLLKTIRP